MIITSNLNNSLFIEHLLDQKDINLGIVGLLDIAKKSTIQNTSEQLKTIYHHIKTDWNNVREEFDKSE